MALTVNINSYISLADAETYTTDRLNVTAWDADTDANKNKALIQATTLIDNGRYTGSRTDTTQALAFPRYDLYVDGILLPSSTTPQRVLDATCELAIYLLQSDYTAPNDMAEYDRVKIGELEVEVSGSNSSTVKTLPPLVNDLLSPFVISSTLLVKG